MDDPIKQASLSEVIVVSVRGCIVDIYFKDNLPSLKALIWAGEDSEIPEGGTHLDANRIRGIALSSTSGRSRGDRAQTQDTPLTSPVGKDLLGRIFNVFGEPIDGKEGPEDMELRSIHRILMALSGRSTRQEIFYTGIKALDLRLPPGTPGQGRTVRRGRCRENGDHT